MNTNFWVFGTQLNNISLYDKDYSLASLHIGYVKSLFNENNKLKDQEENNIKYNFVYSLQIDRFGEKDFYKYQSSNDRIDYTKLSLNVDLEEVLIEIMWPKYSSLLINAGVSFTPILYGKAKVSDELVTDFIKPQLINLRLGIGLQTQLSSNVYVSVNTMRYAFSDFFKEEYHSILDVLKIMFDNQNPKLRNTFISIRYVISTK
ncbi:MAG: hypothetical protein GW823_01325 [Bacteroidetes bacterium]|nr:hypothetical protein [Bacteroidota bacterium]